MLIHYVYDIMYIISDLRIYCVIRNFKLNINIIIKIFNFSMINFIHNLFFFLCVNLLIITFIVLIYYIFKIFNLYFFKF